MDEVLPQVSGQEPADDVLPEGSDRRRPLLAVAALAVVALAVGGVLALTSGNQPDEPSAGAPAAAPAAAPGPPTPSPSASPKDEARAQTTTESRNPFAALVLTSSGSAPSAGGGAAPAPVASSAAPAPAASSAAPAKPTGQQAPAEGETADAGSPAAGTGSDTVPDQVQTLSLVRTTGTGDARVAVFDLDGTEQSVAVGAAFGPDGALLLLSVQQGPSEGQWTAVVQRGSGEPFDVVTGTPVDLA